MSLSNDNICKNKNTITVKLYQKKLCLQQRFLEVQRDTIYMYWGFVEETRQALDQLGPDTHVKNEEMENGGLYPLRNCAVE